MNSRFIDGEGCFYVKIIKSPLYKLGYSVQLLFQITQHDRDLSLLESFIEYFGCGRIEKDPRGTLAHFRITSLDSLYSMLLPVLDEYPLQSIKFLNYQDFRQIVCLMKNIYPSSNYPPYDPATSFPRSLTTRREMRLLG